MQSENITLFFQQGSSDKIYKAALEETDGKFTVNFAYGRRGSTLKTGTKTQSPVDYEAAKKIYDKLINGKKSKGYVPDEDSAHYVYADDQVNTGIHCQLLNPMEEENLKEIIADDDWWGQEKHDGKRMLIQKKEELIAINRKGFSVGAPEVILEKAKSISQSFLIDGEAIGEVLYVFDLLEYDGADIREKSYAERYALLEKMPFSDAIQIVKTAKTQKDKEALYDALMASGSEGIVLKNHSAAATPGRPNSGGTQRKFKFYNTASVIVEKVNNKRSVAMKVLEGGKEVNVGNVTISVNKEIPKAGQVIEVRYLYAYKGGSLYQPTYLHERTDIEESECVIGQLKYKKEV